MGKWILFGLLAMLVWILFTQREGFQDTADIKGVYDLDGSGSDMFTGSSAEQVIRLMPATLITALQAAKPKHTCPNPPASDPMKQCVADATTGSGAMTLLSGDINDIMSAFYMTVYQPSNATGGITTSDVNTFLGTYPMTPFLTANKEDVKALLVAYFITQTHGAANTMSAAQTASSGAAAARGYNAFDIQDTLQGSLPGAINERGAAGEPAGERPMTGPVFGENGPFSGRAGTGQGTGMNAAATLTGSTYAYPPPTETRLDPYDLWPGTKGNTQPVLTGTNMDVKGPTWGGRASNTGSSASAPAMTAQLYGPIAGDKSNGFGSGHPQLNGVNITMLPDHNMTGSDPSNQYMATSRVPGDQDMFPSSFMQSSSYSIANGSQKTDPVPFLTDFSVFQS
jgi:hypothetical protein